MQGVQEVTQGQVVAIDGKTVRHSYDKLSGRKAIHMVSAWASENRLVLGQVKVAEKSNEITAIPELLQTLALSGCIVTIDAMGCQKEIAHQVIEQEADYVLVVKGNQPHLQEDVTELFAYAAETDFENTDYAKTINKGHGRIEIRECWTLTDPDYLGYIRHLDEWVGCRSIAMIKSERRIGTESSTEVRYFISSLNGSAKQTLGAVRQHWGVENGLHWKLDIAFREDECRVRQENAAENFVVLRHVALNLLNQEKTAKVGTHAKRLKAGWDERYLLKILNN
jgi:predicted transposase YbfD/YdcC